VNLPLRCVAASSIILAGTAGSVHGTHASIAPHRPTSAEADPTREELRLSPQSLRREAAASTTPSSLEHLRGRLEAAIAGRLDGKGGSAATSAALLDGTAIALRQLTLLSRAAPFDASWSPTLSWVLATPEALDGLTGGGEIAGSWARMLEVLHAVMTGVEGTREGLGLRVALATALTWSEPVTAMADDAPIDPVARCRNFLAWDREGQLDPAFRTLSVWELRYVVGSWATDDDLAWARANIKADCRERGKIGDAVHGMVKYTLENKDGVSVQEGRRFYGGRPMTLPTIVEVGGVCGAISRFGTSMCQAFGIPAMPVGQPGHCAFIWQKEPHQWSLNNDISGWAESGRHSGIQTAWGDPAWLVPMMQAAQAKPDAYLDAQTLLEATTIAWGKPADDLAVLTEATGRCPMHMAAWRARAALIVQSKQPASAAKKALKDAASALSTQPLAYAELALMLQPVIAADADSTSARSWFLARIDDIVIMAAAGADSTLCSMAATSLLERACSAMTAKGAASARAILRGDAAPGGAPTITSSEVKAIAEFSSDGINRLDGPGGSRHAAWRQAIQRLVTGLVAQPVERDRSLARFEAQVAGLASANRTDDARWLADRLVDACKATKDADLEAKATALRASLG
jgi:chitin-binding protein